jgi:hypothetical protein
MVLDKLVNNEELFMLLRQWLATKFKIDPQVAAGEDKN